MTTLTDWGAVMADAIMRDAVDIPASPGVALRLRKTIQDGETDLRVLAELISRDQGLTAAVLRVANTSHPKKEMISRASTVLEAVQRIGAAELARIVVPLGAGALSPTEGPLAELKRLVWRRSLMSALVCRFLAERSGRRAGDAFACGLMHDFGWLVGIASLEAHLATRPDEKPQEQHHWSDVVDQFHILLGHMAARRWQLSALTAEAILCHHAPERASPVYRAMVDLVSTSDRVVGLIESRPYLTEGALAGLPGVNGHAAPLAQELPRIAAETLQLLELGEQAPVVAVESKVEPATPTLMGTVKPVQLDALWLGSKESIPGMVTGLASDGLVAIFPQPPRANYLMKVVVAREGSGDFELFVTPLSVDTPGEGQYRAAMRLIALSGPLKQRWDRLYTDIY